MNTKIIKEVGIFSAGALCGAAGAFAYFYPKYKELYAEVEELKSGFEFIAKKEKEEEMKEETDEDDSKEDKALLFESLRKDAEQKTDYAAMAKEYISEKEEKPKPKSEIGERIEEMVKVEHPEDDIPTEPYEISIDEFMDETMNDHVGMRFYLGDETLINDDNELADVDNTIGRELYERLASNRYPDGMYVRNPNMSTDYEVFQEEGTYEG